MIKLSPFRIALATGAIALAGCAGSPNYQAQNKERPDAYQDFPANGVSPYQTNRSTTGTYIGTIDRIEPTNRRDASNLVTVRLDNNAGFQSIAMANTADLRTGDRIRVDGGYVTRY